MDISRQEPKRLKVAREFLKAIGSGNMEITITCLVFGNFYLQVKKYPESVESSSDTVKKGLSEFIFYLDRNYFSEGKIFISLCPSPEIMSFSGKVVSIHIVF